MSSAGSIHFLHVSHFVNIHPLRCVCGAKCHVALSSGGLRCKETVPALKGRWPFWKKTHGGENVRELFNGTNRSITVGVS